MDAKKIIMASSARPPSAFSPAQPLHRNMEPSTLVPEEATLNYVNDDIEDIYHRMDNLVPAEKIQACGAHRAAPALLGHG